MRLKQHIPLPQQKQLQVLPEFFLAQDKWTENTEVLSGGLMRCKYRFYDNIDGPNLILGGEETDWSLTGYKSIELTLHRHLLRNQNDWLQVLYEIHYRTPHRFLKPMIPPTERVSFAFKITETPLR